MGQTRPLFVSFCSFHTTTNIVQLLYVIKASMLCLGLKPGAEGW